MSIFAINSVIDQMKVQTQGMTGSQRLSGSHSKHETGKPLPFSNLLADSIQSIDTLQKQSKSQTQNFMSGATDIALNDVMIASQKSSLALSLGVQVRNKMVSAYQEIMSMAV